VEEFKKWVLAVSSINKEAIGNQGPNYLACKVSRSPIIGTTFCWTNYFWVFPCCPMPTEQGNKMKWNILKKLIKSEEKPVSHSWGSTYLPISLHHLSVIWFNSSNQSSSSINAVSCDCLNRSSSKSHKSCICFMAWVLWQCNVQVEQVKSTWWWGSDVNKNIQYCLPCEQ